MTISKPMMRSLAAAALLTTGAAQAAVVMYTDEAAFQAALSQVGYDFFQDLKPGLQGVPNLDRQTIGGQFSYTVSSQINGNADGLFVAGTQTDHWISTEFVDATLFLTAFSQGVTAVALYGVTSNPDGSPAPGNLMNVAACPLDVNAACVGDSYISTTGDADFRGFISLGGFRFVSAWSDGTSAWPAISEVQIGNAVPEPGTYALALAALAGVGLRARRRRAP